MANLNNSRGVPEALDTLTDGDKKLTCCVKDCSVNAREVLGIFDDGTFKIVLCLNHVVMYVLGMLKHENMHLMTSSITEKDHCELCDQNAIWFEDSETLYKLCSHHMEKLIRLDLGREEYSKLYLRHGNTYLLHDDFYTNVGEFIQPIHL